MTLPLRCDPADLCRFCQAAPQVDGTDGFCFPCAVDLHEDARALGEPCPRCGWTIRCYCVEGAQ